MAEQSKKAQAWEAFDRIVAEQATDGDYSNPWTLDHELRLRYEPDFRTLERLLGVPLYLEAATTTGVPALALDVWLAFEFRRAGFSPDAVWPRASSPRVLPGPVSSLLEHVSRNERIALMRRLTAGSPPRGVAASSANILGKNYLKQVDVVMSNWATGPELLVSTKRMDSSFGKNAANRVEESYGDVKNLRLRHPMAALGFFYGLRSTIFDEEPDKADWLIDLLQKLGREDDAYHAVSLLVIEYADGVSPLLAEDDQGDGEDALAEALLTEELPDDEERDPGVLVPNVVNLDALPKVKFLQELVPPALQPGHFLQTLIERILDATPINFHVEARERRVI